MTHWKYKGDEITDRNQMPEGTIGFIYKITTKEGRTYIGKKSVISVRKKKFGKKKLATITDKRLKKYEIVVKDSDWLRYTGSSKPLNEDISNGIEIDREILHYCSTKKQMSYFETKYQMVDGSIEPGNNSYVSNIGGRWFPKDILDDDKGDI